MTSKGRRTLWAGLTATGVFAAALPAVWMSGWLPVILSPPINDNSSDLVKQAEATPRKTYRYSVIPGGAYNDEELGRARRIDAVVQEHYSDFGPVVKLEINPRVGEYYISYRRADRVYWTSTKRRIQKGELLLSDGRNLARTRCANRLSASPQQPTNRGNEPTERDLNAFQEPQNADLALMQPEYDFSEIPPGDTTDVVGPSEPASFGGNGIPTALLGSPPYFPQVYREFLLGQAPAQPVLREPRSGLVTPEPAPLFLILIVAGPLLWVAGSRDRAVRGADNLDSLRVEENLKS